VARMLIARKRTSITESADPMVIGHVVEAEIEVMPPHDAESWDSELSDKETWTAGLSKDEY
jgi:hypothetical protein